MYRAAAAEKFFKDILKIKKVEILKNLTKDQVVAKMKEIENEAIKFEEDNDELQAVNSIFINWVGFSLDY